MKIEDFKYELILLRDLAHANGRERTRLIRALLHYSPGDYTRFRVWVAMVVIIGGIAAGVIAGIRGENLFPILLCAGLAGVGSAAIGYRAARKRRVDSLIALSEKLNARAGKLPVGEFKRIAEMLSVAPEKRMSSPAFVAAAFASDGLLPTSCGTVHWSVDFSAPA